MKEGLMICAPVGHQGAIRMYVSLTIKIPFLKRKADFSDMSLAALIEYKNISKKTLQESIESEMSGNLEDLLVAVGERRGSGLRRHAVASRCSCRMRNQGD